jgi:allantoinase
MHRRDFSTLLVVAAARKVGIVAGMALLLAVYLPSATLAQDRTDRVTGFAREPVRVAAWPAGRKVAVSFALFVEEFGFGQGPVFRPDLATRNPDLVNEAFRQYGIDWGIVRVGRLFRELGVPLSVALNAEFPGNYKSVWKEFRALQPNAPIIAHGMNNTSHMLPLGRGLAEQRAYIRRTLNLIAEATGVRPTGWSSPSVYSNGDTMQAIAAEGITYTIDQMDSDIISRLKTPVGSVVLLPYPVVTVDMASSWRGRSHPRRSRLSGWITCSNWPVRPAPILRDRPQRWSSESTPLSSAHPTERPPCGVSSCASRRTMRSG